MEAYNAPAPAFAAIFGLMFFSVFYIGVGLLAGYLLWGIK